MDSLLLARILGTLDEGVIAHDFTETLLYANALAAQELGFASAETLEAAPLSAVFDFVDVFNTQGEPLALRTLLLVPTLADGSESEIIARLRVKATGVERWSRVKSRPVRDANGQVEFVITTFYDATDVVNAERTQAADSEIAEARLHEVRERLRMTIESVRDYAIFSLSLDDHVMMWNSGAERIFGYSEAEALGQSGSFIFTPEDRAEGAVELELGQALLKGYAEDERWHLRKDQSRFFASGIMSPLRDTNGEVQGFVKVARDITERRRTEEERANLLRLEQAARIEAERANQLKLQFLGMISHELRTPLTSIKGFITTLMASDVVWEPEQKDQFIEIIDLEADKLRDLVDQLLDVSSLQAGILRIHPECATLRAILDEAWPQIQAVAARQRLTLEIADSLPDLNVDVRRIGQVIVNLIQNASKYSPEGSSITLEAHAIGPELQITVIDEGEGIPLQDRESVFEAFQQVERRVRRGGAGLGLAICKGVVEAHGGRIWIVDRDPPGTTIVFTLPAGCADGG